MFDLTALIKQELANGIFYSQFSESSVSGGEDIFTGSLLILNTRGQYLI